MGKSDKLLTRILSGTADNNMAFDDLRLILIQLGFTERTRGSHHIFRRQGIPELINIQREGKMAKPYQVRQVRATILRHKLGDEL